MADTPLSGRLRTPAVRVGVVVGFMVLALVTYHGALRLPMSSDGRFLTYQNAFVRDLGGLARIWTADFFEGAITHGVPYQSGYYRPITNALFWMEYRFAGDRDLLYHLSQVLLHGLNALLVALLCFRISRDRLTGGVAGLVFLLHPVHAFAATEPAARADVVFPLFYVLGLVVFDSALREPERASRWKVGLTVLLYLLAVLSKEMGITLPAVLVLLVLYRHFADGVPLRRIRWTLPVWGALAAYLVWRFGVIHLPPPSVGYAAAHTPLTLTLGALKGILIHISRIVLPLGADYPELNPRLINVVSTPLGNPLTYIALAVVVCLAAIAFLWRWNPFIAFWSGFFLLSFSPLLRVDNISGTLGTNVLLTQERWIYLPAVAVAAVAGYGVSRLVRSQLGRTTKAVLVTAVVVVLVMLGRSAAAHAGRDGDPFAQLRRLYLFSDEQLNRLQRANKLILYAQWVAAPMGDLNEAESRAREAVRLVPDSPISAAALANILGQSGKWEEVVEVLAPWRSPSLEELRRHTETNFRVADDLNRVNPGITFLLARAYAHVGDGTQAMALLCESVRRGFNQERVADALRESYALNGPPACAAATDRESCVAGAQLPADAGWTLPFDAATCGTWVDAVRGVR
ncbi:MAG: hypothetical protein GTN62_04190 [Gemmatimonadales bacterium]|nr:hypothetical protein [Gemmatimonadales bacterium]NIN10512.1 hypothetical protein [Gemmatimonadales bacterium]NIN49299.1 hypothetical protein [Gemmatimonadales bacterium]NIP06763.1 hypothetical protein [Gemmatimonadales bacterium]NIR02789.1 hypothetical protein [Gemmatimonadales bacterium]